MSFINLMANDIWSDADITRRTESMIRSEFSLDDETILNRKVLGISLGTYTPNEKDLADIERYNSVAIAAQLEGVAAREDMALLLQVFPLEEAQRRLDKPSIQSAWEFLQSTEPEPIVENDIIMNDEDIQAYRAEREIAFSIIQPYLIEVNGELTIDVSAIEKDNEEREAAQSVIDNASVEVRELFDLRKNNK